MRSTTFTHIEGVRHYMLSAQKCDSCNNQFVFAAIHADGDYNRDGMNPPPRCPYCGRKYGTGTSRKQP
jgi:hypothetical protein